MDAHTCMCECTVRVCCLRTSRSNRPMQPFTRRKDEIAVELNSIESGMVGDATQKKHSFVAVTRQHPCANLCA